MKKKHAADAGKDKDYKELYINLRKNFDRYLKHKRHNPGKCNYCRDWYKATIKETKKVEDKHTRDVLLHLWNTLWINNNSDFDIIYYEFVGYINDKKSWEDIKKILR